MNPHKSALIMALAFCGILACVNLRTGLKSNLQSGAVCILSLFQIIILIGILLGVCLE